MQSMSVSPSGKKAGDYNTNVSAGFDLIIKRGKPCPHFRRGDMKALAYLIALTAGLSGAAIAQNTNPQAAGDDPPEGRSAPAAQGNRDPGADTAVVPADNPGSRSVNRSAIEAPRTSNQTSDRAVSREWQGLGSTGGGTGTGTSSGTSADEVAPGQDGSRPADTVEGSPQDPDKILREKPAEPPRE